MEVFIVMQVVKYEGSTIMGVYETHEHADQIRAQHQETIPEVCIGTTEYVIDTHIVEIAIVEEHPDFICISNSFVGYMAVHMQWDKDIDCYTPRTTGLGRYPIPKGAIIEARKWAKYKELEYR